MNFYDLTNLMVLDIRTFNNQPFTEINEEVYEFIRKNKPYGIILFAENIISPAQTKQLISDLKEAYPKLMVGIDQEGGIVTRVTGATNFSGSMSIGATDSLENAYLVGKQIGMELNALGVDINFSPIADVNNNPNNPIINIRAFGSDERKVSEFANAFNKGQEDGGVLGCFKHFPGHGDVSVDSHVGLPIVDKKVEDMLDRELYPFSNANTNIFMCAHIKYSKYDELPFTLSKATIDSFRKYFPDMILISDAMDMKAINDEDSFVHAVEAGVDIVCMPFDIRKSSDLQEFEMFVNRQLSLVKNIDRIAEANAKAEYVRGQLKSKICALNVVNSDYAKELELKIASEGICLLGSEAIFDIKIKKVYTNDAAIKNIVEDNLPDAHFVDSEKEADLIILDSAYLNEALIKEVNICDNKIVIHTRSPYVISQFNRNNQHLFIFGLTVRKFATDIESGGQSKQLINLEACLKKLINKEGFTGKLPF